MRKDQKKKEEKNDRTHKRYEAASKSKTVSLLKIPSDRKRNRFRRRISKMKIYSLQYGNDAAKKE